ncbi:hypothetical protein JS520_00020 [Candidatus Vidania fulgoroideae]|nr:hypothetical protein JS520_00020 [Candidatus Vidania fulgoroideae]
MCKINRTNNSLSKSIAHLTRNYTPQNIPINISIQVITRTRINIKKTLTLPYKTTTLPIYYLSCTDTNNNSLTNIINITDVQSINLNKYKIITTNTYTYQQLQHKPTRKIKKILKRTYIAKSTTDIIHYQQGKIKNININNTKPINIKVGNLKINTPLQISKNISSVITLITTQLNMLNIKAKIKLFLHIHGHKKSYQL